MGTRGVELTVWRALFVLGRGALARGNTFHTFVVLS